MCFYISPVEKKQWSSSVDSSSKAKHNHQLSHLFLKGWPAHGCRHPHSRLCASEQYRNWQMNKRLGFWETHFITKAPLVSILLEHQSDRLILPVCHTNAEFLCSSCWWDFWPQRNQLRAPSMLPCLGHIELSPSPSRITGTLQQLAWSHCSNCNAIRAEATPCPRIPSREGGHPGNRLCPLSMVLALSEHHKGHLRRHGWLREWRTLLLQREVPSEHSGLSSNWAGRVGQGEWQELQPSGELAASWPCQSSSCNCRLTERVGSIKHTVKAHRVLRWRE